MEQTALGNFAPQQGVVESRQGGPAESQSHAIVIHAAGGVRRDHLQENRQRLFVRPGEQGRHHVVDAPLVDLGLQGAEPLFALFFRERFDLDIGPVRLVQNLAVLPGREPDRVSAWFLEPVQQMQRKPAAQRGTIAPGYGPGGWWRQMWDRREGWSVPEDSELM